MRILVLVLMLAGCATQQKEVTVTYEPDKFGVPSPVVDGKRYEMTDTERRDIGQKFVNAYCPAE